MNIYQAQFTALKSHIDQLNHVNNVVYVEWIQNIANQHWNQLKEGYDTSHYIWVVIKHEIDYLSQALLGDQIEAKTWVGETRGIKSVRHVEFYKNQTLLVKAKTTFCLLNATSFKPSRITDTILEMLTRK